MTSSGLPTLTKSTPATLTVFRYLLFVHIQNDIPRLYPHFVSRCGGLRQDDGAATFLAVVLKNYDLVTGLEGVGHWWILTKVGR